LWVAGDFPAQGSAWLPDKADNDNAFGTMSLNGGIVMRAPHPLEFQLDNLVPDLW